MRLLLDTHFVIWMVIDRSGIRRAEAAALDRCRTNLVVSVVTLWELRTKWEARNPRGERKGVVSPATASDFLDGSGIAVEAVTREAVLTALATEIDHNDPFDRMLLVHAQQLGARLLTRDRRLAAHPLSLPL